MTEYDRAIAAHLERPPARILDLGRGTGRFAAMPLRSGSIDLIFMSMSLARQASGGGECG